MRARLVAAAAGTLVVASAALAFSLGSHPVIAGTNTVEPFYAAVPVPAGVSRCQSLASVPTGASRLRMAIESETDGPVTMSAEITARSRRITAGTAHAVGPGVFEFELSPPTTAARNARLCVYNSGPGGIVLSGETKKERGAPAKTERHGVASVIFLDHSTTWLARARTIARHFGEAQAGAVGSWTLWVAAAFAIAAWALALWWLVAKPGTRN